LANPQRVQTQQQTNNLDNSTGLFHFGKLIFWFILDSSSRLPPTIDSHQHSIFPFDNYELECTNWEDDIIWDSANMPSIPSLTVKTLGVLLRM